MKDFSQQSIKLYSTRQWSVKPDLLGNELTVVKQVVLTAGVKYAVIPHFRPSMEERQTC